MELQREIGPPLNTNFRAAQAVARDLGISDTTLWRWKRRGWINIRNIFGRNYVDLKSLKAFEQRAAAGEFTKEPTGAACASHQARIQQKGTKNA